MAEHLTNVQEYHQGYLEMKAKGELFYSKRYCVFSKADGTLKVFENVDAALKGLSTIGEYDLVSCHKKAAEKGGVETAAREIVKTLSFSRNKKKATLELGMRLSDGGLIEIKGIKEKDASAWMEAVAEAESTLVTSGWIRLFSKGKWKRRFAVYQKERRELALYRSHEDYVQFEPDACRGHGVVEHAVTRPSPKHPFGFACYAPEGTVWEMSASDKNDLRSWLKVLPLFRGGYGGGRYDDRR